MSIWWLSETIPLPVTALLPLIFLPVTDVEPLAAVSANYAHPLFFLFLGGFMIAAALQNCGLHKRIAFFIIRLSGSRADQVIGGFMIATAGLSMWISNTATTFMMYAVALSVLRMSDEASDRPEMKRFGAALMLSIAYAASIGGVGTLIGTPPNAVFASIMEQNYGLEISFLTWMMLGMPVVLVMLPTAWLVLTRLTFPIVKTDISGLIPLLDNERAALGAPQRKEIAVAALFVCTIFAWIFSKQIAGTTGLPITDTTVALVATALLFTVPLSARMDEFMLDWQAVRDLPLGFLLVFGGGLALADAMSTSGLAQLIGQGVASFEHTSRYAIVLVAIASILIITEFTSNTASAATFIPIFAATGVGLGLPPQTLAIPVAIGASMAFMLPVATPPNTVVYAYEHLTAGDMMRAGIWLNLAAALVCFGVTMTLSGMLFDTPRWP